jgi:hypothetical protein
MEREGVETMRSLQVATLVCTLTLAGSAAHANEQTAAPHKQSQTPVSKPTCAPVTSVEFSQAIDAWRLACLAGEEQLASDGEQNLMILIDRDLTWCANVLEQFHNTSNAPSADKSAVSGKNDEQTNVEDEIAWEMYGAKKIIAKNIRMTDAFSNKYRLLGDYEDLIKREKSADRAGVPLDYQEKGESKLREAGK